MSNLFVRGEKALLVEIKHQIGITQTYRHFSSPDRRRPCPTTQGETMAKAILSLKGATRLI
jgi:hypothetical protein